MSDVARRAEKRYLTDTESALKGEVNRFAYLLTVCVIGFVVLFLGWAHFAVIDEVTRGEGRVIPSQKIQVVQNLEGGILAEMLVHEGQIVQANDVILRIANTNAQAAYRDSRTQALTLKAMIARLSAESEDKDPVFPPEVVQAAPQVLDGERSLYTAQITQFKSAISALNDQLTQRQQEIAELKTREQTLSRSLVLAKQERDITAPLVDKGAAAKLDLVKIERTVSDLTGQIDEVRATLPRAEAARDEAQGHMREKTAGFHSDARTELNKRTAELSALSEKAVTEKDRVERTEVRSPVRGIIKEIKVNTIGAVIRPGQDLIEIVPLEDTLLIEAKVRPSDIAFLRPGQAAMVKVTAYDFSIYGGLKATLEQISADTIKDDDGPRPETFFRITLRTDKNYLGTADHPLPIMPGMTAQAEILTGQKSVLDYLMKPILKARDRALTER